MAQAYREFGGGSPILVVLNKIDEHPGFEVNRRFLQEKYPGIKGFYRLSCATDEGLEAFITALQQALMTVELLHTAWPQSWFDVKTALERMKANYISYAKYRKVCGQCGIAETTAQETLVEFLHDLGVSLHFKDLALLETQVLRPKWVTQAVYQIINSPQLARGRGILPLAGLHEILTPARVYPRDKHPYLVDLMKKFELCYELDRERVLVPDLLEVQEPAFDFPYETALQFRLEYDFLPRAIMPRFIVRRHQDIRDELRWRTGVVLHNPDLQTTAVVKSDDEAKTIAIWVQGERRREYFAIIRHTLQEIHRSFEKLLVTELVPLPDYPAITVEYQELIGLEQMGKTHIPIGKLRKEYRVKDLLNGIASEQARQAELQNLRDEKIYRLRRAHVLETDPAVRFKYEKQLEAEEA